MVVFWFEFFWIGVYVISGIYEIFVINIGFIFIFFVSILWFINKCYLICIYILLKCDMYKRLYVYVYFIFIVFIDEICKFRLMIMLVLYRIYGYK